jgi:hypothetical protein
MTRRMIDGKTMPSDEPTLGNTSLKSYIASILG